MLKRKRGEAVLKRGKTYIGKAMLEGVLNQTAHKPIKTGNEQMRGIFGGKENTASGSP